LVNQIKKLKTEGKNLKPQKKFIKIEEKWKGGGIRRNKVREGRRALASFGHGGGGTLVGPKTASSSRNQ
jgi:hypothetical protein